MGECAGGVHGQGHLVPASRAGHERLARNVYSRLPGIEHPFFLLPPGVADGHLDQQRVVGVHLQRGAVLPGELRHDRLLGAQDLLGTRLISWNLTGTMLRNTSIRPRP